MRTMHQMRVDEFMRKAGQDLPNRATMPDEAVRRLRAELILEEAVETIEALGFGIQADHSEDGPFLVVRSFDLFPYSKGPDIVKVVDGCCDIKVVTTGTLSSFGLADEPFQEMVDYANLRKFGPGGHRGASGKWVKPPDFVGPDEEIARYLRDECGLS